MYHEGIQHFERLATVVSEVVKSELESLIIDENERRLFSLQINAQLCYTFSSLLSIVAGFELVDIYPLTLCVTRVVMKTKLCCVFNVIVLIQIKYGNNWS